MIRIVRSHRLEALADALADALAPRRTALDLAPDCIIVPSTGMARWVEAHLAARFRVAANLDQPYPAQFLWRAIGQVLRDVPEHSPFDPDALAWRVFRLFAVVERSGDPVLAPVQAYLRNADALARMQLAERIATVFDRYLAYRGDVWLGPWARGELLGIGNAGAEAWQAWFWRTLLDDLGLRHDQHPFTRLLAVLARGGADRDRARAAGLPECVRLFAVPTLAPVLWQAFEALGRYIDIECYALAPSREYIADLVTEAKRARIALAAPEAAAVYEVGHPLLAANGRQAIDLQLALIALEDNAARDALVQTHDDEAPLAPPATLLAAVQHSILRLDAAPALPAPDGSVQIHACHSLVRQLEVLHDELLRRFAADPSLRPADVLVCVPDLAAAAPAIDAVFGAVPEARRIAYRMTGRAEADAAPLVAAALALFDFAQARASADAALAVLRVPACARRFGFDAAALARATDWLAQAGARWGWDAAHRAELGLPPEARHTWVDALERIVLGYALPDGAMFDAVAGIDGVEGTQAPIAAALLEFAAALRALTQGARAARSAQAWSEFFALALERFFAPEADELADAARLRAAIAALADLATRAGCDQPIDLALARERLGGLLEARAPGGALTGAVTFAGLGPLRAIPARVIALLGLDDGVFPRRADPIEFDLTASAPQPGDRQRRDEDRALFLDALMAARELLFIGHTGRDAREGTVRAPSVVVGELIEFVARCSGDAAVAQLVREHPLQAFSPRAFAPPGPSYAQELLAAAECVRQPVGARRVGRLLCTQVLPPPEAEARVVRIEQLVAWLAHPARHFLRERLRIQLDLGGTLLAEDEPFLLDAFEAHGLRARLVEAWRRGDRDDAHWHALAFADAALPHGVPGERAYAMLAREVRTDLAAFEAIERSVGARDTVPIGLAVGGLRIEGVLHGVHGAGVLGWRAGKVSMHARAEAWVAALLASAVAGAPRAAYWHCREGAVLARPTAPEVALAQLVAAYADGLRSPLLCPPRTAWALLRAQADGADAATARSTAERAQWRPSDRDEDLRESEDVWWRALLGDVPERVPDLADFPGAASAFGAVDFIALATRVYGPMVADTREDAKTLGTYRAALGDGATGAQA